MKERKFTYVLVVITLIVVPLAGICHSFYVFYPDNDSDASSEEVNNVAAWLAFYPLVCGFSILKYIVMHQSDLFYMIDT